LPKPTVNPKDSKARKKGEKAAQSEMKELHERGVFTLINVDKLSINKRKREMESLFLTEKRDGQVKGRSCANGNTQRVYESRRGSKSKSNC
jgi:hypothetical protein